MVLLSPVALSAFFLLVFIQTTAILLFKLCQFEGVYTFSPTSSIAITEFTKLCMAAGLQYRFAGGRGTTFSKFFNSLSPVIVANYAGLALLYTTNNYITFYVHLAADPGTYTLGKSVTPYLVAVLLRLSGDRLHSLQWLCIIIQCCGIAVTQYDPCGDTTTLSPSAYGLIGFSACITATCGVWNQKVVKGFETPVHLQNMVLYSFGFLLATTAYLAPRTDGTPRLGFFEGYSALPAALIFFQAFQGLAVTWVLKYADAIIKNFASTAVMAILVVVSVFLFGLRTTPVTWLGVIIVLTTTYTYMTIAVRLPKAGPKVVPARAFAPGAPPEDGASAPLVKSGNQ